jgi:hypothetical protein
MFAGRQQLIDFFMQNLGGGKALQDSLQYFGTFSRVLNQPSFYPDPNRPKVFSGGWGSPVTSGNANLVGNSAYQKDDKYNPAFRKITVKKQFTRGDGTVAHVDDPLVKKRFPLNRLAWLTYKGPSASNMGDPVVQQMIRLMGGDPGNANDPIYKFVASGTGGTNGNIYKYFGLTWNAGSGPGGIGGYWKYDHGFTGSIASLDLLTSEQRDPDFFELLKASIHAGSLGYSSDGIGTNNGNGTAAKIRYRVLQEATQVDDHIVQIGANIIDQAWPENFPTQIVFNDGFTNSSFWGKVDLPYYYGNINLAFLVKQASPPAPPNAQEVLGNALTDGGRITALQVPIIWNPNGKAKDLNYTSKANTEPQDLRISISNFNVANGSLVAANSPSSFHNNIYPQTITPQAPPVTNPPTPPDPKQTYILPVTDGVNGNDNFLYWNKGTWDPATGTIKMLEENALNNTALYFDNASAGHPDLYREPTPLMRNVTGNAGSQGLNLRIDSNNLIVTKGGYTTQGVYEEGQIPQFLGFYLMSCPQRWVGKLYSGDNVLTVCHVESQEVGCTVSLEYKAGNSWIPYDQRMVRDGNNCDGAPVALNFGGGNYNTNVLKNWRATAQGPNNMKRGSMIEADPRTRRWFPSNEILVGDFLDSSQSTIRTLRPDGGLGDSPRGDIYQGGSSADMFRSSFDQSGGNQGTFCADAIGGARMIRRAMGAYAVNSSHTGSSGTVGLPLATAVGNASNTYNRPIMLHRPFRTVAELGYVFSDTPWKNLDFFTPESGDTALLDTFCIAEDNRPDALAAGKVDLNTRQSKVLTALLMGANRDILTNTGAEAKLDATEAKAIAEKIVARTKGGKPFDNIAKLVGSYGTGTNGATPPEPFSGFSTDLTGLYNSADPANNIVKRLREASVRALSDTTQAGTWNLLIDLIAQAGRYPSNASGGDKFLVEAETRYWVHVAIDRQTGKVIDQQVEKVVQ